MQVVHDRRFAGTVRAHHGDQSGRQLAQVDRHTVAVHPIQDAAKARQGQFERSHGAPSPLKPVM